MSRRSLKHYVILALIGIVPILVSEIHLLRAVWERWMEQPILENFASLFPYLLLMSAAILGLTLNQARIFFAVSGFTLLYAVLSILETFSAEVALPGSAIQTNLISTLPILLMAIFAQNERRLLSRRTALNLILLFALPVSTLLLTRHFYSAFEALAQFNAFSAYPLNLPIFIWIPALCLLVFAFIRRDKTLKFFFYSSVLALLPIIWILHLQEPDFLAIGLICASTILLYCVVRTYWQQVYIDELTEIPNRRAFNEVLPRLHDHYAIAMVDIDHFKKFNDTFGHQEGDNVLRMVAAHLNRETGGRAYRYGGEEFSIVFDGGSLEQARDVLNRTCRTLAKKTFYIRSAPEIRAKSSKKQRGKGPAVSSTRQTRVTVSVGVSQKIPQTPKPEDVVARADQALYKAKSLGRNRVVLDAV